MTDPARDAGRLPLVSVVIPAYNYAAYLDEALRSVLDQTYPKIELIVLDDGSTDATREVLERYDGRFHWETHENMGQANTLNRGWLMSEGGILAYLSPDDVLLPGAVETSVTRLLENPDAVLAYCDYYLIDEGSRVLRRVSAPDFDYREMVAKFVCPPGPGAFFRRDAFEAAGLWDGSYKQMPDYDYWLRLGLLGRFLRIPEALAAFRVHEGSLSFAATDEGRAEESVRAVANFYRRQEKELPDGVVAAKDEALSNAHIFAARSHLRSGRYARGARRLFEGLVLYPRNLSPRTFRVVAHGLLNHVRHRVVQKVSGASLRKGLVR